MPVHQASVVCGFCKLGTDVSNICGTLHKSHLKNGSICAAHHRCMVSWIFFFFFSFILNSSQEQLKEKIM